MKKTLITVALAVASAAISLAATLPTPVYTLPSNFASNTDYPTTNPSTSFSSSDGSKSCITLTAVFNWDTLVNSVTESTGQAIMIHNRNGNNGGGRAIGFSKNGDNDVIVSGVRIYGDTKNYANSDSNVSIKELASCDKLVLTMVLNSNGLSVYGYDVSNEEVVLLASGATSDPDFSSSADYRGVKVVNASWLDSAYVYNSALSTDDILAVSRSAYAAAVPEPATATLSLLALAGLCARRRRK